MGAVLTNAVFNHSALGVYNVSGLPADARFRITLFAVALCQCLGVTSQSYHRQAFRVPLTLAMMMRNECERILSASVAS